MKTKTRNRTATARADVCRHVCRHYDKKYVERSCIVCGAKFGVCPICCPHDKLCGDLACQPKLSAAEIAEELDGEASVYQESYREADGVVRDEGARRTIVALQAAARIVRQNAKSSDRAQ